MKVKPFKDKIIPFEDIEKLCTDIRQKGFSIATSNGCFDILHPGHLEYLQSASDYGRIFIVGINSDKSVRRLKGAGRPVNNEICRASVIASLGFVDYCVIFSQDTPVELLGKIKPAVHVKGGDYLAGDLPEKKIVEENGGVIKILPLVKGYSTTLILEKLRDGC